MFESTVKILLHLERFYSRIFHPRGNLGNDVSEMQFHYCVIILWALLCQAFIDEVPSYDSTMARLFMVLE